MPMPHPDAPAAPFNLRAALLAGAAGTAAMLVMEIVLPRPSQFERQAEELAARRLPLPRRYRKGARWALPFGPGTLFAVGYAGLWHAAGEAPTWKQAALLGLAHSTLVQLARPAVARLSRQPLDLPARWLWGVGDIADHVVYATVTAEVYRRLTRLRGARRG